MKKGAGKFRAFCIEKAPPKGRAQLVKKVEVQEALLPLNRRRDYCRSPRSFRDTPAGR